MKRIAINILYNPTGEYVMLEFLFTLLLGAFATFTLAIFVPTRFDQFMGYVRAFFDKFKNTDDTPSGE